MVLVGKIGELELEVQKLKADKKKIEKKHREEIRNRDRKEVAMVALVATCIALYCIVALMIRGYV